MKFTGRSAHPSGVVPIFLVVIALGVMMGPPPARSESQLSSQGDTFFFTTAARPLADFPPLESVVPMPQNINPMNRKKVHEYCSVQVAKRGDPVPSGKGSYVATLVVMDRATKTFTSTTLSSGKIRTGSEGVALFDFIIPTELFASGFKSGDISAWSYARLEFRKRKATYAMLSCDLRAKK